MQLKSLRLGAMGLAGAVLFAAALAAPHAAALPTPHAAAQISDDPAISSEREAGQEGCWYDAELILRSTEDRLTLAYWLGEAYEHRTCVRETVGAAFEDYRRSVDDANMGGPATVQDAFVRRALDLVSANARLRKFMLEIASTINSEAFRKDVEARIAWIEEIESGDPSALYETALDVRDGNGLPQHRDAAVTWLERAGDHGVPEALYAAARMELDDLGEGPAAVIGEDLLERAARRNVVEAQKEFGLRLVAQGAHWDYLYFNAYGWLLLAEANGEDVDDDLLSMVRKRLSEEEL